MKKKEEIKKKYTKKLYGANSINEYEELAKTFLRKEDFELKLPDITSKESIKEKRKYENKDGSFNKGSLKREMFKELKELTGETPPWGTTTGIRPVKLARDIVNRVGKEKAKDYLIFEYLMSPKKASLILDIDFYQRSLLKAPTEKTVGLYIGIPFCPTRCYYCSFTSNRPKKGLIDKYLKALEKEIIYTGTKIKEKNINIESIYIGGGTPTTLTEAELEWILKVIEKNIIKNSREKLKEYSVEAGRVDTITEEKLKILSKYNVGRISINPQTIHEKTLKLIGREGTLEQIKEAFKWASGEGTFEINMDIIAGLEREKVEDFQKTLEEIVKLNPDNITVHTLAVKRASNMAKEEKDANYKRSKVVFEMIEKGENFLKSRGYKPYYLYRQKNMAGNLENIGYCINDKIGIYNIRIMEEIQTIIALGAGGISKVYFENENRLERIANIMDPGVYINRIDEMIGRKEENLFPFI